MLVGDVFAGHLPDSPPGTELHHRRGAADHRHHGVKWLVAELGETDIEDPPRMLEESQVTVAVGRVELADLLERLLDRPAVIEVPAVVEDDAVPWIQRHELYVIFPPLAEQCEQLIEQKRRRDDGWAHVEGESVPPDHHRAAAKLILLFDQ